MSVPNGPKIVSSCRSVSSLAHQPPVPARNRKTAVMTSWERFAVAAADRIAAASTALGANVSLDGPSVVVERSSFTGTQAVGRLAAGRSCRFVRCVDGWLAVNLARPEDWADATSWADSEVAIVPGDWKALEPLLADRSVAEMVVRAAWFDLAVSTPGEVRSGQSGYHASRLGEAEGLRSLDGVVVVDFSSLWAGPLCTRIMAACGATVVKVESPTRPDGARFGNPEFFAALHAGKQSVVAQMDRETVITLMERADVVVTGSRAAAFERLGVLPAAVVPTGPRIWLSITGYGWHGPHTHRIGFGDDAAVAGGLLQWDGDEPRFVGDAIADPLTGLVAAAEILERLASGGRWHVDIALARIAASV
jgi:hypothetical protein